MIFLYLPHRFSAGEENRSNRAYERTARALIDTFLFDNFSNILLDKAHDGSTMECMTKLYVTCEKNIVF